VQPWEINICDFCAKEKKKAISQIRTNKMILNDDADAPMPSQTTTLYNHDYANFRSNILNMDIFLSNTAVLVSIQALWIVSSVFLLSNFVHDNYTIFTSIHAINLRSTGHLEN